MKKKCFIDIETTGLNPAIHEIIEVAIIFDDRERYHRFIKPKRLEFADPIALTINKFHDRAGSWKEAITHEQLAFDLACLLHKRMIIGHNPFFDMLFIYELLEQHGEQLQSRNPLIDTITLAHEHLQPVGLKKLSLDSIRAFLGWSNVDAHTAMKDCEDVQRLYLMLMNASSYKRFKLKIRHLLRSSKGIRASKSKAK